MKEKVVEWLRALPNTSDVEPATLTIGSQTWEGASYTRGDIRHYYLVGGLPKSYLKGSNTCYRFGDDDYDWFVGGYLKNYSDLEAWQQEFHPFGNFWVLTCWDLPKRIDEGLTPYKRMKVSL